MLLESDTFVALAEATKRAAFLGLFPPRINVRRRRIQLDRSRWFFWLSRVQIFFSLCNQVGLALFTHISVYLHLDGRMKIIVPSFLIILTILHAVCLQFDSLFIWKLHRAK